MIYLHVSHSIIERFFSIKYAKKRVKKILSFYLCYESGCFFFKTMKIAADELIYIAYGFWFRIFFNCDDSNICICMKNECEIAREAWI